MAPERLEEEWQSIPTSPDHLTYVELLCQALSTLNLRHYSGLLGVDTIVYRSQADHKLYLAPCIELNVRPTMGHIALELSRRFIGGRTGRMTIEYDTHRRHHQVTDIPLYLMDSIDEPGAYPLTPMTDNSRFTALLYLDA